MPASGRGANLDTSRRITSVRKPPPKAPTPLQRVTGPSLRAPIGEPFKPAQQQAQRKVEHAQRALPKEPTPDIPRLSHPTHTQTYAALKIAQDHQKASGKPAATYWKEHANDPRSRAYVDAINHYVNLAQRYPAPVSARTAEGESAALLAQSRQQAIERGEYNKPGLKATLNPLGPLAVIGVPQPHIDVSGLLGAISNVRVAPKGVLGNAINEVVDLPGQSLLSGALTGTAVRHAVGGKPQELEALSKGVLEQILHPLRSAKEAPVSTALLFAGGESALARVAGRVGRVGERLDDAGKVVKPGLVPSFTRARPDLNLIGGEKIVGRKYNPDPLRKAGQVAYEKSLTKLPGDLRQRDPFQAEGWRLKRNMIGGVARPGRVDYIASGTEHGRKRAVRPIINAVKAAKPKIGADAVSLIKQGVVRRGSVVEDLSKRLDHLDEVRPGLSKRELGRNRQETERVQALLKDEKFLADPSEAFAASAALTRLQKPLTALLVHHGHLRPEQIRAALFPYAQAHLGAVHDGKALRGADGKPLSNETILADMKAHGVTPSFVSHQAGISGGRSFYQDVLRTPTTASHARTGAAFHKGVSDFSYDALTGSIADSASKAAKLELHAGLMSRLTHGRFDSEKAAQLYKENFDYGQEGQRINQGLGGYVVHNLGPDQVLGQGQIKPGEIKAILRQFGLAEHAPAGESPVGKYTLIPKDVKRRLEQHNEAVHAGDDSKRLAQSYVQGFRHAKLLTSTRRVAGDFQEQLLRMGMEGVAPMVPKALGGQAASHVIGRAGLAGSKIEKAVSDLAESDGPLGARFREIGGMMGSRGGLAVSSTEQDIYRLADGFQEMSSPRYLYGLAGRAKGSVPGRVALAPWHAYRKLVEATLQTAEHKTYQAMLGKAGAEFFGGYHNILKMQDGAMKALVAGKLDHNLADALVRRTDEFMGNWSHLTPRVKWAVANVTPFGLWWLNSVRWLYRLPVTHPIKTALAAALYNATRQSRNEEGQGFDATNPVPGFLQGSIKAHIPVYGNVNLQPSYDSPMGAAIEPLATAADQIGPAVSGPYYAALNRSSLTHEPLTTADGKELGLPAQLLNVIAQGVSGPTLFATQIEQAAQKGGKPLGSANLLTDIASLLGGPSQIVPGTEASPVETLVKMGIPLRFTREKRGAGGTEVAPSPLPASAPVRTRSGGPSALQRLERSAEAQQAGRTGGPSALQLLERKR